MLQDSELARRIDGKIQIRPGGLRLRWELNELVTADGHTARGTFTAAVRALPESNELKMLEEALLTGEPVVRGADVRDALRGDHFDGSAKIRQPVRG